MKCSHCGFENPADTQLCGQCGRPLDSSLTKTIPMPKISLPPGFLFAERYQILEELGKGGMGQVYKVMDKEIDEQVALKLLKHEISADKDTITRFRNELKLARKISHRNVCRMFDLGKFGEHTYITMEYVPGEDLKSFIRRSGQLSVEKAVSIAKQICEGLSEAHTLGVVHRDLKPQNIMIDLNGNARIMDFGIARSPETKGVTEAGMIIGTPEYMSPEQIESDQIDNRSDIYSLGIILFEMLTGQVVFQGDTFYNIARQHTQSLPPDPGEFNPAIPEELSQLILKCLEKDKTSRYQSAAELYNALDAFTADVTEPPSRSGKIRKRIRITGVALMFMAIIAIVAVVVTRSPQMGKSTSISWKNSIAVLPFENLSADPEQEYFCDGMTEQLISNLTHIKDLKVISRTSVMAYKNQAIDIRKIASELDVNTILEGSIRKAGNRIRIAAQLINAEDGAHLWAEDYDRQMDDIFAIQDEVSESIATTLLFKLTPQTTSRIRTPQPNNVEAYEYYLKGRYTVNTHYIQSHKEEDFQQALAYALKAIEIDPVYAAGYMNLGFLYEIHYLIRGDPIDLQMQQQYIEKAYELDPNLAEANAGKGFLHVKREEFDQALPYFKKALEINPNHISVCHLTGAYYHSMGLYYKAIEFYSRAVELEPLQFFTYNNLGNTHLLLGDLEQAKQNLQKCLDIQPNYSLVFPSMAYVLILEQNFSEANEFLTRIQSDRKDRFFAWVHAVYLASLGQKEEALAVNKNAHVYLVLDEIDQAIIQIIKDREILPWMHQYLHFVHFPLFVKLKNDPRFQSILDEKKMEYEERLKKYGMLN